TCQGGLDRYLGSLQISDLSHQDDIRVLAQEFSQGGGEIESDGLVHLDLIDAGDVELYRIFGSADIFRDLVQLGEDGVEGSGLAATCRSGDQDHPIWLIDGFMEYF